VRLLDSALDRAYVAQELADRMVGVVEPIKPVPLENPNDKWLMRSAYQKAVRRGDVEVAIRAIEHLAAEDMRYAWNTAAIVAVEDVGPGEWVSYTLAMLLKTHWQIAEPCRALSFVTQGMCAEEKTSACCELAWGCDSTGENPLVGRTPQKLWSMVEEAEDLVQAYWAISALRKHHKADRDPYVERIVSDVLNVECQDFTELERVRSTVLGLRYGIDPMHFAQLPILRRMSSWNTQVVGDSFPATKVIADWVPSYAWDIHVRPGKEAIALFVAYLSRKYAEVRALEHKVRLRSVGAAVFVAEGGLLNRKIWCPELALLKLFQDANFVCCWGGAPRGVEYDLTRIVLEEIDELNVRRAWVRKFGER